MDGKLIRQKKNQLRFSVSYIIKYYKLIEWDIIPEASCIILFFGSINPDTLEQNIEAVVTISTFGKIYYVIKKTEIGK